MSLITIDIDESIEKDVLKLLESFPKEKLKINRDAVISPGELEEIEIEKDISELDLDEDDDYFMLLESGKIMHFEFDMISDPEFDEEIEIRLEFENGRRFFAFFTSFELVASVIESEDYYFSALVIVRSLSSENIRSTVEELIYNEEFFDAFEELSDTSPKKSGLFDPFRMN